MCSISDQHLIGRQHLNDIGSTSTKLMVFAQYKSNNFDDNLTEFRAKSFAKNNKSRIRLSITEMKDGDVYLQIETDARIDMGKYSK